MTRSLQCMQTTQARLRPSPGLALDNLGAQQTVLCLLCLCRPSHLAWLLPDSSSTWLLLQSSSIMRTSQSCPSTDQMKFAGEPALCHSVAALEGVLQVQLCCSERASQLQCQGIALQRQWVSLPVLDVPFATPQQLSQLLSQLLLCLVPSVCRQQLTLPPADSLRTTSS